MGLVIIPREDWIDFQPKSTTPAKHAGNPHVVHWFGPGTARTGFEASKAQALSFARYHRFNLGWNDLGYNWVILRDERPDGLATVLEGRGRDVRGAHAGNNTANGYAGVLIMAGTGSPAPTTAQLNSLVALTAREGWGKRTGHQEWSPTSCPGPVLMPWIERNRFDAPRPITKPPKKLTLGQRLKKAGLGGKSIKKVLKALGHKEKV